MVNPIVGRIVHNALDTVSLSLRLSVRLCLSVFVLLGLQLNNGRY